MKTQTCGQGQSIVEQRITDIELRQAVQNWEKYAQPELERATKAEHKCTGQVELQVDKFELQTAHHKIEKLDREITSFWCEIQSYVAQSTIHYKK